MDKQRIIEEASTMRNTHDLLKLLNTLKKGDLGEKGFCFSMPQLHDVLNPSNNKKRYRTFTIPKKSGGERTIMAPYGILKSIQHYLNLILQAYYQAPDAVTGFVPSKSVIDNAERHIGGNYVFNADLKDFFPSIKKARIWATLQTHPYCFNSKIANAIAGICCVEMEDSESFVLPQGSPCSPILTNIVCSNLDRKLSGLAKRFGVTYSRYADDITFSSSHNVYRDHGVFLKEFRRIIKSEGFKLNPRKTRLQKKGQRQEVTGLVVSDRVNVKREYVREIETLLYIWERYGRIEAFKSLLKHYTPKQNLNSRTPSLESVILGKLNYLRMIKGEENSVWRKLQRRYNKLTHRHGDVSTDIEFINIYSIAQFEKLVGTSLKFGFVDSPSGNKSLKCCYYLSGKEIDVSMSQPVRTRVEHLLTMPDVEKQMAKFKISYRIGYCKKDSFFWMLLCKKVTKDSTSNPLSVSDSSDSINSNSPSKDKTVRSDIEQEIDTILSRLVSSNFDLKTLEAWDKIKSS